MKPSILYQTIAHFFLLLFIYTAMAKFMEMDYFRQELSTSPFLGSMAGFVSWALPIAEILIVVVLLIPTWRLKGLYVSLLFMVVYTLYLVWILFIADNVSCGCGGIIEDLSPKQHLFFNIACIALAWLGIRAGRQKASLLSLGYHRSSTALTLLLFGFIGWIVLTAATAPPGLAKTGFEGKPLPAFNLLMLDSVSTLDSKDIPNGKPFIVMAFSPYCPHCQREISDIIQHIGNFRDTHIYLVTTFPLADLRIFYTKFLLDKYQNITVGVDNKNNFLSSFNWHMIPFTTIYNGRKILSEAVKGRADIAILSRCVND